MITGLDWPIHPEMSIWIALYFCLSSLHVSIRHGFSYCLGGLLSSVVLLKQGLVGLN
jgi:hypothetical protein